MALDRKRTGNQDAKAWLEGKRNPMTHDDEPGRNQGIRSHKKSPKPKEGLSDEKKGVKQSVPKPEKTGSEAEVLPPERKRKVSKSSMAAKLKRNIVVQAIIDGKTTTEAGLEAGYSPRTARQQASMALSHPDSIKTFTDIMEREGITDEFLAKKIRTLLDAREIKYFQTKGIVTDEREVEALETQRKTAELAAKLKGHLKDRSELDINVGIMAMVVAAVGQIGPENEGEDGEG